MEPQSKNKKNIGKRLIVLNIVLVLLAVTIFAAIKLSPGISEEGPKKEKGTVEGADTTTSTPTPEPSAEEKEKVEVDETKSKIELNGQSYTFDQIPEMTVGDKFRISGATEPLSEIEVLVRPNLISYSTKANANGEWQIEIDTNSTGEGDHTFQTKIIPPGEINGVTFDAISFKVKAKVSETHPETQTDTKQNLKDTLTSLPVLLSVIGFAIVVCLVTAFLLIRRKKAKSINVDAKISSTEIGVDLNPEQDLKIATPAEESQSETTKGSTVKVDKEIGPASAQSSEKVLTPTVKPSGTKGKKELKNTTIEEKENAQSAKK